MMELDELNKNRKNIVYEHVQVKKMLHYVNVWFLPFKWGVNTYRGCEHSCVYCNARYTHEYLKLQKEEFAYRIIVKDNAAELLDKEFSRERWKKNLTVNLATVTDPYQPAEKDFNVTRDVLKVFLKHNNALMLTTKSDLILRDLDLLKKIGEKGFLNVVITLSTLDDDLRKEIEPRAPSVEKRLGIIQKLHNNGIITGVAAIPLLPFISDEERDLEELVKTVTRLGADYLVVDVLNLRGESRGRFMEFLKGYDSKLIPKYQELYKSAYCEKELSKSVRKRANRLIKKYKLDNYILMKSFSRKSIR
jgi:DNA repair photolyase